MYPISYQIYSLEYIYPMTVEPSVSIIIIAQWTRRILCHSSSKFENTL